jgi:hypothetical protein
MKYTVDKPCKCSQKGKCESPFEGKDIEDMKEMNRVKISELKHGKNPNVRIKLISVKNSERINGCFFMNAKSFDEEDN